MRMKSYAGLLVGLALITTAEGRARALDKRAEAVQQGDFVLIGNTLAQDCGASTPLPVVGTLDCNNAGNLVDLAPDVFWRAEAGLATADSTVTTDTAQSAARLELPQGAQVTHAYLYWSAQNFGMSDNEVTLQCVDQAAPTVTAQAQSNWLSVSGAYSAFADVKDYVLMNGSCTYLVGGVTSSPLGGALPQSFGYAAWWMVVFYTHPSAPHRRLALFDGLETIGNGGEALASITGFQLPSSFAQISKAKLGVAGFDGDASLSGDKILVNEVAISDATGDAANFFNSSRSHLGSALSVTGDLPQLSGEPASMDRLDLDVVDVTSLLMEGQTQVDVRAVSEGDLYQLAGVVLSVPTFTDEDGDKLSDDEELLVGTSPTDVDSDDDGVPDGLEGCSDTASCPNPAWSADSDGDGLINALDPDSDNDGLLDGTELGLDCAGMGTKISVGHCIADADAGKTKTDPLSPDTDKGGARDGSEDWNLNGQLDSGETDPTAAAPGDDGTLLDADADGLSDALEGALGSKADDADSDDDGLLDGLEANPTSDTDADGLINLLDVDSDNDSLYDGTEAGKDCSSPATSTVVPVHCAADADPLTTTSPVSADTDRGGARDGSEDANLNGMFEPGEGDPTAGHTDDDAAAKDTDGDAVSDALEATLGSNPMDKDTDDDGVLDGAEANPADDTDGDGAVNVKDHDSDGDGLFDGTERGDGCADPDTDKAANHCVKDADEGETKTCVIDADTDDGGVSDGSEDFNKNGLYDAADGEGDPNDPNDDKGIKPCDQDLNCGPPNSGAVCDDAAKHCIEGCRGVDGSRCPEGDVCSSTDSSIGYCIDGGVGGAGGGSSSSGGVGAGPVGTDPSTHNGCKCGVPSSEDHGALAWALSIGALALARARRSRRASRAQRLARNS